MKSRLDTTLKKSSKPISRDASVAEFLARNTKEQLLDIKRAWMFSIPSTFKKQELVEALSKKITQSMPEWFETVPWPSYALMTEELELPVDDPEVSIAVDDLLIRGIGFFTIVNNNIELMIPNELKALIPTNANAIKKIEQNHLRVILIQGLINLYGLIEIDNLVEILNSIVLEPMNSYELKNWIETAVFMYLDSNLLFINGKPFLVHDYVDDPISILFEKPELEPYNFSLEDISTLCYYRTTEKSQPYLDNMLNAIYDHEILDEDGLDEAIDLLQLSFLNDEKIIEAIKQVLECINSKDLDDLNSVTHIIMDYHNHSPKWILKGNSPSDLLDRKISRIHKPANPIKKISRNDPCPCGSGKKYKKCCLAKDEKNNVTRIH
ncbi:MAG: SEC-C domain-containing protein [Peptostreptococcaceae bacterium]|nr:SEC-C domain-containing protein [Peptostreptococcaceae bacterium]